MFGWMQRYRTTCDGPPATRRSAARLASHVTRFEIGPDEWCEIRPTQYALRVYKGHSDNYPASAVIQTYGDKAWMSMISNPGFYRALRNHVPDILDAVGVRSLEGYVTPAHARLMRMMFKHRASFAMDDECGTCADRDMPWVTISAADDPHEPRHFG
jgi:hypothetical protein